MDYRYISYVKDFATVSRIEFAPINLINIFIPLFLAARSLADLQPVVVFEIVMIWFLAFWFGSAINCLYDKDIDEKYKTHLAKAVSDLGNALKLILLIEVIVLITLGIHLSLLVSKPTILLPLLFIGIFFAVGYSIKPLHFKNSVLLNAISLTAVLYFIPMLFVYFVIGNNISLLPLLILFSYAVMQYSTTLGINTLEDFLEDREMGIKNPPVVWGIQKTLKISFISSMMCGFVVFISFCYIFLSLTKNFLLYLYMIPFLIGISVPIISLYILYKISRRSNDEHTIITRVKRVAKKFPVLLSIPGIVVLIAGFLVTFFK